MEHITPLPLGSSSASPQNSRLHRIAQARQLALVDLKGAPTGLVAPWIEESWQRCLSLGLRASDPVVFEAVTRNIMQATADTNRLLVETARPVIRQLARAIADTRYFAILANHQGVVVDVDGVVDHSDKRVHAIARVGVDLSESAVGTSAIGAALREMRPVWLHRGEHFFKDTSVYSCAGAPVFGPRGECVGMLDLTGVETTERPELRHLVAQSVRSIENALVNQPSHPLMLRINWPGIPLGFEGDGLIGLDEEGQVLAANQAARVLLPELMHMAHRRVDCRDVFATPFEMLVDHAHRQSPVETPLWSGLRVQVKVQGRTGEQPMRQANSQVLPSMRSNVLAQTTPSEHASHLPLKDMETSLIRQAVDQHKGNVAQAARALGISRATVYRKLKIKRAT